MHLWTETDGETLRNEKEMNLEQWKLTVTIDQILLITHHAVQYLPVNCNAVLSCAAAWRWERQGSEGGVAAI